MVAGSRGGATPGTHGSWALAALRPHTCPPCPCFPPAQDGLGPLERTKRLEHLRAAAAARVSRHGTLSCPALRLARARPRPARCRAACWQPGAGRRRQPHLALGVRQQVVGQVVLGLPVALRWQAKEGEPSGVAGQARAPAARRRARCARAIRRASKARAPSKSIGQHACTHLALRLVERQAKHLEPRRLQLIAAVLEPARLLGAAACGAAAGAGKRSATIPASHSELPACACLQRAPQRAARLPASRAIWTPCLTGVGARVHEHHSTLLRKQLLRERKARFVSEQLSCSSQPLPPNGARRPPQWRRFQHT